MSFLGKRVEGAVKKAIKNKASGGSATGKNPAAGKKGGARKGKSGDRIERAVRELLR